jgi:hypothetical protein
MSLYKIIQTVNGHMVATQPADIFAWVEANNRSVVRINTNRRNRAELQGQPVISGLCGPMYDGEMGGVPVIRYEGSASNDILSR